MRIRRHHRLCPYLPKRHLRTVDIQSAPTILTVRIIGAVRTVITIVIEGIPITGEWKKRGAEKSHRHFLLKSCAPIVIAVRYLQKWRHRGTLLNVPMPFLCPGRLRAGGCGPPKKIYLLFEEGGRCMMRLNRPHNL